MFKILLKIFLLLISTPMVLWANGKTFDRETLLNKIQQQGSVKVIVQFRVNDIKRLTHTSTKAPNAIKAALTGTTLTRAQINYTLSADQALANGISSAANTIASQLSSNSPKKIFKTVPYMGMTIDSVALLELEQSSQIVQIIEDKPMRLPDITKSAASLDILNLATPLLDNTVNIINADDAWAEGYTGTGWYVAILDTGIRTTHEMFAGKSIIEACRASGSSITDGLIGDCPNGTVTQDGAGTATHFDYATYIGADHGTHVSAIAAGQSASLSGVAKDADIIAVNVFSKFGPVDCGGGISCALSWVSDQIAGLEYIYSLRTTYNIGAVNMSLGGGSYNDGAICDAGNSTQKLAIDNLRSAGIATVIATGNDGSCIGISSPACISSAISVGATDDTSNEASFSNSYADMVDIYAPGISINSAIPDTDTSYQSWNGTSMATPHVAGAWVLFRQRFPSASVNELETALQSSATAVSYRCGSPSNGKFIDIIGTITNYSATTSPISPSITINSNAAETSTDAVTLNLSASDNVGINGYYVSETNSTPATGDFVAIASAVNYADDIAFTLSGGFGNKTVYAWFKDTDNHISTVASDAITYVDTSGPINRSIIINGNATTTTSQNVTLSIAATDETGITGYYVSENSSTPAVGDFTTIVSTTSYTEDVAFTLSENYGNKTVYAWFIDADNNISTVVSNAIQYIDNIIPISTSFSINNDNAVTTEVTITLTFSATDNIGITGYYASESTTTPEPADFVAVSSTANYTTSIDFILSSSFGDKAVYLWFKDANNNISNPVSRTILYADGTAPIPNPIIVNNSSTVIYGNSITVQTTYITLIISAEDLDGIIGYYITEIFSRSSVAKSDSTPDPTDFIPVTATTNFSKTIDYNLSSGDGDKTIQLWFINSQNKISTPISQTVTVETVSPTETGESSSGGGGGGCSTTPHSSYSLLILLGLLSIRLIRQKKLKS